MILQKNLKLDKSYKKCKTKKTSFAKDICFLDNLLVGQIKKKTSEMILGQTDQIYGEVFFIRVCR